MWRASAFLRSGVSRRTAMLISLVVLAGAPIVRTESVAIGLWVGQVAALVVVQRSTDADARSIVLFAACWLAGHTLFGLDRWPMPMLASLGLFALVLALFRPARELLGRLRLGSIDGGGALAIAAISLGCAIGLVAWSCAVGRGVPVATVNAPAFAGILCFALVNAAGEEIAWRFFAWEAARRVFIPATAVVAAQAISFGVAHVYGVPSGGVGVVLATAFGAALGWLRHRTRGLAAPVVVHVIADIAVGVLSFN